MTAADSAVGSSPGGPASCVTSIPATPALVATSSQALRSRPVTALSETHLLVWGGDDGSGDIDRADGFAIELSTGEVAPIPNAPITRLLELTDARAPRYGPRLSSRRIAGL